MSGWLSSLWSTPKTEVSAERGAVVLTTEMDGQRKLLEKKAKKAEFHAKKIRIDAKKRLELKDTAGAKTLLQRAHTYDQQAALFNGQLNAMLQRQMVLDSASTNSEVIATTKEALRTGQGMIQQVEVDDVHAMMDDWKGLHHDSVEIGKALGGPMSFGYADDEDVDDELAAMMADVEMTDKPDAAELELPDAPKTPLKTPLNVPDVKDKVKE